MSMLTVCRGLPASGKSTWANEQVKAGGGRVKRVNRDNLRSMADAAQWSRANEASIVMAEKALADLYLTAECTVLIDDTNLSESTVEMWRRFAREHSANFSIQDFTDVPLEECIKRDQNRPNYVGEKVIRRMWRQYLRPQPEPVPFDHNLANIVICDLDGTLALLNGRDPYDASTCEQDAVNQPVLDVIEMYDGERGCLPIFVSGRMETYRPETERWLAHHAIGYYALYMRPAYDTRPDDIIKREIYEREIKGKYNVILVLDDRDRVVRLWRSIGLPCFQVNEGDF